MSDSDPGDRFNPLRLYRDGERGVILGVCAGAADHFGLPLSRVRVLAALPLLFPPLAIPAILAYLIAGFLLPLRPHDLRLGGAAAAFRDALSESPERALELIETHLRQARRRVERLESYVTSSEFDLYRRMAERVDARHAVESTRGAASSPPPPPPPLAQ